MEERLEKQFSHFVTAQNCCCCWSLWDWARADRSGPRKITKFHVKFQILLQSSSKSYVRKTNSWGVQSPSLESSKPEDKTVMTTSVRAAKAAGPKKPREILDFWPLLIFSFSELHATNWPLFEKWMGITVGKGMEKIRTDFFDGEFCRLKSQNWIVNKSWPEK